MKRGVILVLAILFLIPAVSATIVINGPQIDKYNVGDKISVSGYIQEINSITGFLKFSMECGDTTHPLQMVPVSLTERQQLLFPRDIEVPDFVASMPMQGECRIKAELMVGNTLIDWGESSKFEITKDLDGKFDIEEPRVQVGSDVVISGEIAKLDGTEIDGSAEIYFEKNDTRFLVTVLDLKDGILSYTYKTSAIPEGRYFVDVLIRDTFGNEELFNDAANFVLIKQLYVTGTIDKDSYLPGDIVTIQGTARTVLQDPVATATVLITIGDKSYTTRVTEGKFEGTFQLPSNMESGRHTLIITVKDDFGNTGSAKESMSVQAIPSSINIRLNNNNFLPRDIMELTGTLYDQAGAAISSELTLEVYDPDENIVISKKISSARKEAFSFPEFAKPGQWTARVFKDQLEQTEAITVSEHMSLGVMLDQTLLKVKNLGNVKFNDEIEIEAVGDTGTYVIDKKKTIYKNNTAAIDLSGQLPTGMYTVNIKTPDGQHQFSNVRIADGKSWLSFNLAYVMLVMACVGLLCFVAYSKMTPRRGRRKFEPQKHFKMKDADHEPPEGKRFSVLNIGKNKDAEMADFKARILNDVKKAEVAETRRQQRQMFSRPERKQEGSGGLFSMFD